MQIIPLKLVTLLEDILIKSQLEMPVNQFDEPCNDNQSSQKPRPVAFLPRLLFVLLVSGCSSAISIF